MFLTQCSRAVELKETNCVSYSSRSQMIFLSWLLNPPLEMVWWWWDTAAHLWHVNILSYLDFSSWCLGKCSSSNMHLCLVTAMIKVNISCLLWVSAANVPLLVNTICNGKEWKDFRTEGTEQRTFHTASNLLLTQPNFQQDFKWHEWTLDTRNSHTSGYRLAWCNII